MVVDKFVEVMVLVFVVVFKDCGFLEGDIVLMLRGEDFLN